MDTEPARIFADSVAFVIDRNAASGNAGNVTAISEKESLLQTVCSHVSASAKPVSYKQLAGRFAGKTKGCSDAELRAALEEAVNGGRLHAWGNFRGARQCYWNVSRADHLAEKIVAFCTTRARTRSEITIPYFTESASAVSGLLADGRLRKFPKIGTERERIGTTDESYVAALRSFAGERLRKAGIQASVFGPAPSAGEKPARDLEREIVDALAPDLNIPVSTVELRKRVHAEEADLARAVFALRDKKRVYLTMHDNAPALSPEGLKQLIHDGHGTYYVALTLRRD